MRLPQLQKYTVRGATVVVKDSAGKVIGTGPLSGTGTLWEGANGYFCMFRFEVDVPVSDFYSVQVTNIGETVLKTDELTISDLDSGNAAKVELSIAP
jgi:hypothetical protein